MIVRRTLIGRSLEPVVVIDAATGEADGVRAMAARADFRPADEGRGGYPGLRAPMPPAYVRALLARIGPALQQTFPFLRAGAGDPPPAIEGAFSIVTAAPEALHPLQRIPHVDTSDPHRIAVLHFLSARDLGGTAFYRHCATGLEQLTPDERERFLAARAAELARALPPAAYPGADSPGYERLAAFDGVPDRVLAYRSCNLHSGIIDPGRLSPDPLAGRLTANLFLSPGRDHAK